MTTWLTAHDLAGLPGVPTSERRCRDALLKLGVPHRERAGKGGGIEFDCAHLPELTRQALMLHRVQAAPALPVVAAPSLPALPPRGEVSQAEQACADARALLVRHLHSLAEAGALKRAAQALALQLADPALCPPALAQAAAQANQRQRDSGAISPRTLLRWHSAHRDHGWHGLLPAPVAASTEPLDADVARVLKAYLNASGAARNLTHCAQAVVLATGAEPESWKRLYAQARRALPKLDKVRVIKARHRGAERDAKLPFKRRDSSMLAPNDVWVADGHTFKAKVRHPIHGAPFAPEVTVHMDVATRRVVGWSVDLSESTLAVGAALRHAVGNAGVPAILYTDGGSGETAKVFDCEIDGLCARLGIEHKIGLPGKPQGHGVIERSWQTHMLRCARQFGTYQGDDADARTVRDVRLALERERRALRRAQAGGEVVALSNLVPSWQQFVDAVRATFEAYNAQHRHRSLPRLAAGPGLGQRMTPDEAWAHMADPALLVRLEPQAVRHLFMPSVLRVPRRGEVALFNQVYFSPELMQVDGEQVSVRYDIHDPQRVQVWTVSGRFVCEAVWNANRIDYFPRAVVDMAREKRVRAAQKRLQEKFDLAEAELQPLLEAPTVQGEWLPPAPVAQPLEVLQPQAADEAPPAADARPAFFSSAADRYEWLMQHRHVWAEADLAWLERYAQGEEYQALHTYFAGRGLLWNEPPDTSAFKHAG